MQNGMLGLGFTIFQSNNDMRTKTKFPNFCVHDFKKDSLDILNCNCSQVIDDGAEKGLFLCNFYEIGMYDPFFLADFILITLHWYQQVS